MFEHIKRQTGYFSTGHLLLFVCALLMMFHIAVPRAFSGLMRPPEPYVKSSSDNRYMLVMVPPKQWAAEHEENTRLLDGSDVSLRQEFSSNGYYEVKSRRAIWKTKTYAREGSIFLSENGQYMLVLNVSGYQSYSKGSFTWGIKFFDSGKLFKTHMVEEFIDYPSMTPPGSSNNLDWIDWDATTKDGFTLSGDRFVLYTTTHARYEFDITTGGIVTEFRLWRQARRLGLGLLLVAAILPVVVFLRRAKRRHGKFIDKNGARPDFQISPENLGGMILANSNVLTLRNSKILSFSIRGLLLLTVLIAVLCLLLHSLPAVGVFLSSVCISLALTLIMARMARMRKNRTVAYGFMVAFLFLLVTACCTWFITYGLSIGPTFSLLQWIGLPYDVRMVVLYVAYGPWYWLLTNTSMDEWEPVRHYFDQWGPLIG